MTTVTDQNTYDVIVVGAGAAGVGVGVTLKHAGIEDFLLIDRHGVGASFARWPAETRFITPSFATNSIGMLDLNSVAIGVSPAYSLQVEHPTGAEYAEHLQAVAAYFELPVRSDVDVLRVTRHGDLFLVDAQDETLYCKHLIWAAGEFQYPKSLQFEGAELCRHTATVPSYSDLPGRRLCDHRRLRIGRRRRLPLGELRQAGPPARLGMPLGRRVIRSKRLTLDLLTRTDARGLVREPGQAIPQM